MFFDPENVDMAVVSRYLDEIFTGNRPAGYLLGKTALRDAVVAFLQCSQLEAEDVVDTMIARGFLRYEGAAPEELDDLSGIWTAVQPSSPVH